jgi:hypothetical protein
MLQQFRTNILRTAAALALLLLGIAIAEACNVPVFRYALERWRADPYRVTVFHRGPLSDAERALVNELTTQQEQSLVNVAVRTVDVSDEEKIEPGDQQLFETLKDPQLPVMVVQYPAPLQIPVPVWTQPLTKANVTALTNSPLRKELIKRLVDGETAIWLLLESGDAARDKQAEELLAARIKSLEKDLTLPELTDTPEDELLAKTPLQIKFSLLRVPREESDEPLVQMLLHAESDLLERSDPMIFPIFGRGRALLPLIGAGITAENIQSSAGFLVGACSCEVKELNPGFDLLLAAEWDSLLTDGGVPLTAAASGRPTITDKPELVEIPSGKPAVAAIATPISTSASTVDTPKGKGNPALVPVLVGLAAVLLVVGMIVSSRRSVRQ